MSQDSTTPDGAWLVARLLAGAPDGDIDTGALDEPWASLSQAIAETNSGERLAAFEHALAKLPDRNGLLYQFPPSWTREYGRRHKSA